MPKANRVIFLIFLIFFFQRHRVHSGGTNGQKSVRACLILSAPHSPCQQELPLPSQLPHVSRQACSKQYLVTSLPRHLVIVEMQSRRTYAPVRNCEIVESSKRQWVDD